MAYSELGDDSSNWEITEITFTCMERRSTLRRSSPCEMFSASMKDTSKWWILPASPECGRNVKVLKPRSLQSQPQTYSYDVFTTTNIISVFMIT